MPVTICNRQRIRRLNPRLLKRVAMAALRHLNTTGDSLNIAVVDDTTIAQLNKNFHKTNGPTDVLSFPYDARDEFTGEIVVSIEHTLKNARRYKTTPGRELTLYIIHGILHLHGHDDLRKGPRGIMRRVQRDLMSKLAARFDMDNVVYPPAS